MPEQALRGAVLADTLAIHLGLAIMLGALASQAWVRQARSAWAHGVVRASGRMFFAGGAWGLVAMAGALWLQAAVMSDGPLADAGPTALTMLRQTHYGHAWLVGCAALIAALVAAAGHSRVHRTAAWLALALFALTRSAASHAAANGDFTIQVGVDGLHRGVASLWVGGVLLAACQVLRTPIRSPSDASDAAAWISALSTMAGRALAVVLLTGVVKGVWTGLSMPGWWASAYAATLFVKLGLVAAAVGLGGFNRWQVLPELLRRLRAPDIAPDAPDPLFVRVIRIEAAVLVLVLLAAAVLGASPTPADT